MKNDPIKLITAIGCGAGLFCIALGLALASCSKSDAVDSYGVEVSGPVGYRCFVVFHGGAPVGGNCEKE